ncbi:MAG: type IV pilus assembly protein PilM [Patescibacteria group bacterium]|nr:type IV pilus assembly protein PilM [Patescibacteria group bacterium]
MFFVLKLSQTMFNFSGITDFFKDITNFVSSKNVLGVDIGTVAVKIVELARRNNEVFLDNYGMLNSKGYLERSNEAIQTSSLKLVENDVIRILYSLLNEIGSAARTVVANIPLFSAFVVPIEMPVLSPEETAKSIVFQARRYIPLPLSQVSFEWNKLGEFDNPQGGRYQKILMTAIPNELIRKYKIIFKSLGLHLTSLEVESQALARSLTKRTMAPTMVIDIGGESTGISVVEGGAVLYAGQTDYGGASLTQALARGLDISPWRAEELKCRRGLLGFGGEFELSTSLLPFLDVIIQESERVRRLYERSHNRPVEEIILVGGSANLPGIENFITSRVKLKFVRPRPFAVVRYKNELEPAMRLLNNEFALAVGLALRFYI